MFSFMSEIGKGVRWEIIQRILFATIMSQNQEEEEQQTIIPYLKIQVLMGEMRYGWWGLN